MITALADGAPSNVASPASTSAYADVDVDSER